MNGECEPYEVMAYLVLSGNTDAHTGDTRFEMPSCLISQSHPLNFVVVVMMPGRLTCLMSSICFFVDMNDVMIPTRVHNIGGI